METCEYELRGPRAGIGGERGAIVLHASLSSALHASRAPSEGREGRRKGVSIRAAGSGLPACTKSPALINHLAFRFSDGIPLLHRLVIATAEQLAPDVPPHRSHEVRVHRAGRELHVEPHLPATS